MYGKNLLVYTRTHIHVIPARPVKNRERKIVVPGYAIVNVDGEGGGAGV